VVGLGEPPHLIGSQAKLTEHRAEQLAVVDPSRNCFRTSTGSRACALRRKRALAASFCASRHPSQSHPSSQRVSVPCAVCGPRRRPCGSVISRTSYNWSTVHGGPGMSPSESQRRTTGGVTLHMAAAWRIEVTSCGPLTTRTLAARGDLLRSAHHTNASGLHRSPRRIAIPRSNPIRVQRSSSS
jgi:hypothetical protein